MTDRKTERRADFVGNFPEKRLKRSIVFLRLDEHDNKKHSLKRIGYKLQRNVLTFSLYSPEKNVFVIGRSMRIDRKIADVSAVLLEENSFFDLFIVAFSAFLLYNTAVPDLTSPSPHFHVARSPISRSRVPDLTSPRVRYLASPRVPASHVPKHEPPRPRPHVSVPLLATTFIRYFSTVLLFLPPSPYPWLHNSTMDLASFYFFAKSL